MDHAYTKAEIVDLLKYRREHAPVADQSEGPSQPPRLAPVRAFRPLSARQVEHRARMLNHLREANALREVRSQKSEVRSTKNTEGIRALFPQLLTFDF